MIRLIYYAFLACVIYLLYIKGDGPNFRLPFLSFG
jgi:hypothetical protein